MALPVASAAFGAAAAVGGWHAGPCLFAAWFCMLSTSSAHELPYPWDSLLLEASFLASLAPAPLSLLAGGGLAGPPPPPWLAFAFRLLVVRVLVGFGKLKFGESGPQDRTYIRSFLVGQPIPTPVGWWAHRLPPMLFEASLLVMWVVEMPLPFLAFFTGWPRLVAAAGIVSLMAGIQLTGKCVPAHHRPPGGCCPCCTAHSSPDLNPRSLSPSSQLRLLQRAHLRHLRAAPGHGVGAGPVGPGVPRRVVEPRAGAVAGPPVHHPPPDPPPPLSLLLPVQLLVQQGPLMLPLALPAPSL